MKSERWNAPAAARAFEIAGAVETVTPYGSGHINDTFLVVSVEGGRRDRNVLQRINHEVFRQPELLMENVERVTAHLSRKLVEAGTPDAPRRCLTLLAARSGGFLHRDAEGAFWRAYRHVDGARSWDVGSPARAREAAGAFGRFARQLMDLTGPRLHDTIPHFHDTPRRLSALQDAVAGDPLGRAKEARAEIDAYLSRETLAGALAGPMADGRLTERVAHNDTKLNNVLIDDVTGEGLCVIDLDTVMPGLFLFDFGDLVRSAANPAAEDERDLAKVVVDVPMFEALARGALEALAGSLTRFEKDSLVVSGKVLTYECGMRFLTDHLLGDTYFRIHRSGHNLDRARAQMALLRSVEEREEELGRLVESVAEAAGYDERVGQSASGASAPSRP